MSADESEDKFVLGTTSADGSQTGNLTFNSADLSGNDASFNAVDIKTLKVNSKNVTGDLDGISEGTFSRYTPQVDGNGDLIEPTQWSSASTENGMIFSKHIVPSQNDTYDIGATGGSRWNALYIKEIFVSGDSLVAGPVKAISVGADGNMAMPSGAKIGGINPGTIVIKGKKNTSGDLPTVAGATGDGYIVGGN